MLFTPGANGPGAKGCGTCNAGHISSRPPFFSAFPLPREDARIPAAYAEARLAAERGAELCGGKLIHTATIRGPAADGAVVTGPGEDAEVGGAQVDFGEKSQEVYR